MTYAIGDPDHIEVHESIRLLFMAAGLDPDLIPGTATIGATGHVDDHNRIADALAWIDENGVLGPDWATLTSTTGSPASGTFTYSGATYTYRDWTANGGITFATAGRVTALIVGGGGGSGSRGGGGGGGYVATELDVLAGVAYPVTIGAGGTGAADTAATGGDSRFGPVVAGGGGGGGGTVRGGLSGGSGGGSGQPSSSYPNGAAATTYGPQGYAGGNASGGDGGGGASAAGSGGTGGAGKAWINGTTYAAGGSTSPLATPTANSGNGANVYNTTGAAGRVIVAWKS